MPFTLFFLLLTMTAAEFCELLVGRSAWHTLRHILVNWLLQPHLTSSLQALQSTDNVFHTGSHDWLYSSRVQPQTIRTVDHLGLGACCSLCSLVHHTPLWYTTRLQCCNTASWVGGWGCLHCYTLLANELLPGFIHMFQVSGLIIENYTEAFPQLEVLSINLYSCVEMEWYTCEGICHILIGKSGLPCWPLVFSKEWRRGSTPCESVGDCEGKGFRSTRVVIDIALMW